MTIISHTDPLDWIEAIAAADPDRPWLHQGETTESYGDLLSAVGAMATRLEALGICAGDRVAVQVEKSRTALHLYLGCLWLGAVYMPLNSGYTPGELSYFVSDAQPSLFVSDPASSFSVPVGVTSVTLDEAGQGSLMEVNPSATTERPTFGADRLAAMLYTSGTTGKPKGAMLTRGNLASSAATLVDAWRFTQADILIHALPIFHVHGLFVATNTVLAAGASMILLPKFEPDAVIDHFGDASCLMGVPTFYTRLLSSPRLTPERCAGMRLFVSGSAPLLAETHREFEGRTGHRILERYGMTETMMNTSNPYDGARTAGTVGPPLPGIAVRITDPENGDPVALGEIGMVEVKGPNVFKGYWNNPEKTKAEFRADGFFITGDLGKLDESTGYLHIIGRGKDLIISGGLNIYPKEVEDAIDAHPAVFESAVIGVPHPDFGEAVLAVVVAEDGTNASDVEASLREKIARFKLPKAIIFVSELPRNTMGKVQKAALRELHKNRFAA